MGLIADLGGGAVGVDTAAFIYFIEEDPRLLPVVAALAAGCTTFVTNDRRLPPVPGLGVIQLSSYVK